ncbi:MAG: UvrD-helicase domain-containing protein, partial [Butyricicoccus sp.]|nr:UvrD-helicase domain-containing protein [Butyricicoccus sp.]
AVTFADDLQAVQMLLRAFDGGWDSVRAALKAAVPQRLKTARGADKQTSEMLKASRNVWKVTIDKLSREYFARSSEEALEDIKQTMPVIRALFWAVKRLDERFAEEKRRRETADFSDLEHLAIKLLEKDGHGATEIAIAERNKYRYIFIDEYQDTNRVQDNIFRAVSGDSVRFMVGDIKQSIYRFRGADPRVFSDYRKIWDKASLEGDDIDPSGASIFMSENFRCSEDIIRFINAVSDTILPYGGIPYEKDDALIYAKGESGVPVPAEIVLIDKKAAPADGDEEAEAADNCEAEYVAARISDMIGRYAEDGSIVKPADIAILLRSPGSTGENYRRALEKAGIPVRTKTSKPLGEFPSVMLLDCLLKFIDNPLRDISTAGVMKSSLFGFTVEDIIHLRQRVPDLPLYTAVLDCASGAGCGFDDELSAKCLRIHSFLEEEKTRLGGVSAAKYLENLLASSDFLRLDEIRGKSAETDAVMKVLSLARSFDRSRTNRSLGAFIDYLGDFLDGDTDTSSGSEPDAVSIMSIHSSKGLEFPVVFLCECAKRRNDQDERRTVLFDDVLGFGMQLPDTTGLVKCDNLIRRSIAAKMAEESKEEEMRMLYVALTRAKSKLIVTAKVSNAEKWLDEKRSLSGFGSGWLVKKASSYIDWMCMAAVRGQSRSWNVNVIP